MSKRILSRITPVSPQTPPQYGRPEGGLRLKLYTVIFESDTPAGMRFDLLLIAAIVASIIVVMIDSVQSIHHRRGEVLYALEWLFTLMFSAEYIARLLCVRYPLRYATSFFGVIDLLSILPTYISLIFPEAIAFLDVRTLRLLRIFRILKLTLYVVEYQMLLDALSASRRKILIFVSAVLMIMVIMGTVMYVVEGPENGFTSIPVSIYWTIVTMTTVGYGDITPHTNIGKMIASLMMLIGWGTLAVPTGIVTAEMAGLRYQRLRVTRTCDACFSEGHDPDAKFCKDCGARLPSMAHGEAGTLR